VATTASKQRAGLLLYRHREGRLEVLLVHPGGPLWTRKDDGAWSIPKGELEPGEDGLTAARREFEEETGARPSGTFIALDPVKQPTGRIIHVWTIEAGFDPATLRSNLFEMEWPPRSGRRAQFPEVDRAAWFTLEQAAVKILKGQAPFLTQLAARISVP
jgi:predicted NUDIX family NTP pyrophosphohydrolase